MIYLFSKFRCLIVGDKNLDIMPNVWYKLNDADNFSHILCGFNEEYPIAINFADLLKTKKSSFATVITLGSNSYIFLELKQNFPCKVATIKLQNKNYCLSVSNQIVLTYNGDLVLEKLVNRELNYSHCEQIGEFGLIYLKGEKNFVIILKNGDLKFANFYDEVNVDGDDRIFMLKLSDCLNHGKVASIKNKEFESYLVYLDNNDLNMKNEFAFLVFLDCFLAGNLNYCNNLLADEIKQSDVQNITKFFETFDFYIPHENVAFTFKKNTLAGVYEFILNNNKIENIIHLTPH